jgi:hypothetical protein
MALDPTRQYEIVFRGELLPGVKLETVRPQLEQLFTAAPEQIQALFSGKRVVIKTGLDAEAAQKYQQTLQKVGLYIEVNPLTPKIHSISASTASGDPQNELPLWTIMKVGTLLSEHHDLVIPEIKVPDFTVAEPGVVLGELPRPSKPVQVSIAHLSMLPLV